MTCHSKLTQTFNNAPEQTSVQAIIEDVANRALIHKDSLFVSKSHKAAQARALIFYRIRKEVPSVTFAQIAKLFSVTPGNVANMIKAHHHGG